MGGSRGGGGHTPYEAPESGRSKQRVRIIEIISEGEIQGLVDGVKSVYLDNTPIQNPDDSYNFKNVDAEGRIGSQDQTVLTGFESTEKEVSVSAEVRKNTPITRTITDSKVDRLRLTLGVSSLFEQKDNGDTVGAVVSLKIAVGEQQHVVTIDGKYSSQYLRNIVIDNLPPVPFTVRVEREQPDSTSQRLQNKTLWASYTEIIDTQFAYPNTALVGIKFCSEYFSNIPTRSYDVLGIKVKVPSNYNPVTRTYQGLWDGSFKIAYSNNPAWVLMDIVTNKRYGLGQRLGEFGVDKWALYQAAQYCDQMIPNGFGGTEPRFTCNVWMTEQRSAYDVINDICSIFRSMSVWNGTELTVIMDRPSDPVWTYTNANVIDGSFSRQYSAVKARHNAIQVEYQDASNSYEKTIEYVSDDEAIRKHGLNLKKVVAFGCTSRGQAYRTGRWILETERLETETITFSVGAEGLMHIPGDIIRVSDNHYAGTAIGGRVVAISGRQVTLDREIQPSGNSVFSFINAEAKHSHIRIQSVSGKTITLDRTPTGLKENSVWSLSTPKITSRLYRAMTIAENDNGSYTITALQHEPQKEAIVDNGAVFEPVATTAHKAPQVEHLDVDLSAVGAKITWQATSGVGSVRYDVRILKDGKLYAFHKGLESPEFAFDDLPDGDYVVVIQAKNGKGQIVSEKSKSFTVSRPPVPKNIQVVGGLSDVSLSWDYVDDFTQTEIWASPTNDIRTAKRVAKVLASFYSHAVGARQTRYYWLRHTRGQNVGHFHQQQGLRAETGADIDEELRLLNEKLSQPIIDQVFDVAAPARKLEMIKSVPTIANRSQFLGHTLIKNEADGRLYKWNGQSYEFSTPASEISGTIQSSQLAAIPTQKLTGQLSANQIAANSIGVNHLQANAVTVGKIAANAVQTANIQAGAVRANHIAAAEISADKLAIGLGGNLLYNPIFANVGANGLPDGCEKWLSSTAINFRSSTGQLTDIWGLKSYLPNENQLVVSVDGDSQASATVSTRYIPVNEGAWYMLSAYVGVHRCNSRVTVRCVKADGSRQDFSSDLIDTRYSFNGGLTGTAKRAFVKFQAPAGIVKVTVLFWIIAIGNESNKHLRVARPMLEECTEHTREPSPWQNAGVTAIHGGSIVTNSITAQQIAANTITGNELVAGTISSRHIATNTIGASHIQTRSLSADKLNISTLSSISANIGTVTAGTIRGTTISGNTISGNNISGGTINGTTITGGVIKGTRLEGATGRFTGELEVTKLIGSGAIEHVVINLKHTENVTRSYSYEVDVRGGNGDDHPETRTKYYTVGKYTATISIDRQPFERYITIEGEASFILAANQTKSVKIERFGGRGNVPPVGGTSVLVTAYATTKNANTIRAS